MKRSAANSGQTLVLALVLLVVLVLAALLLFDLQSVIRGKLKTETSAQAASLAAANWQLESMNLIGEMNLLKASTALATLVLPRQRAANPDLTELLASEALLTEMQTRVSFIGPLIGYGAAEQAAKNNGINGEDNRTLLKAYIDKVLVDTDDRYPEPVNGYYWRTPYVAMLENLAEQPELAVRPSGEFAGIDNVLPNWLADESLYRAILARNWCHPTLKNLLKTLPDSYWESDWFQVDLLPAVFPEESEIFTLDIDFSQRDLDGSFGKSELLRLLEEYELEYDALPAHLVRWAHFGPSWFEDNPYYSGPDLTLWQGPERDGGGDYYYLRANLKPNARTGGPVAAVDVRQKMDTVSRYEASGDAKLVRERDTMRIKVGNYSVARMLGALTDERPPSDAWVILPVFDESVLIPGSMMRYRLMPDGTESLEAFLIWLAGTDSLTQPSMPPPVGTEQYLEALRLLSQQSWRREGWNPDWQDSGLDGEATAEMFFGSGDWGGNPPGWLQAPAVFRTADSTYPNDRVTVVETDSGETEYHYGNRFIRQGADGLFYNNESVKCIYAPGGGGSPSGVNTGPGHR